MIFGIDFDIAIVSYGKIFKNTLKKINNFVKKRINFGRNNKIYLINLKKKKFVLKKYKKKNILQNLTDTQQKKNF